MPNKFKMQEKYYEDDEVTANRLKRPKVDACVIEREQALADSEKQLNEMIEGNTIPAVTEEVQGAIMEYDEFLIIFFDHLIKDLMAMRQASNQQSQQEITTHWKTKMQVDSDRRTWPARYMAQMLAGVCPAFRDAVAIIVHRRGGRSVIIPAHTFVGQPQHVSELPKNSSITWYSGVPETHTRLQDFPDRFGLWCEHAPSRTPAAMRKDKSNHPGGISDPMQVDRALLNGKNYAILLVHDLKDMGRLAYPGASARIPILVDKAGGVAYVLKTAVTDLMTQPAAAIIHAIDRLEPVPLYCDTLPSEATFFGVASCNVYLYRKKNNFRPMRCVSASRKEDGQVMFAPQRDNEVTSIYFLAVSFEQQDRPTVTFLPLDSPLLQNYYYPPAENA
jgi:hypothetical protein